MNVECQVQFDAFGDASEVNSAVVYAFLDKRTYYTEIPVPDGSQSIKLTSEHLVVPAFHVLSGCIDATFGWERVRFWLDPDSHRVKWGRQERQVRTAQESMFSEVRTPGNPKKIQLEYVSDPKPLMIDVADVLAYCAAQALCAQVTRNKARFQAIQECFTPVVFPVPGGGPLAWHRVRS